MPKPWTSFVSNTVLARAIDLSDHGESDHGWLRDDALTVVAAAEAAHVVILGGDVWLRLGDQVEIAPGGDNWWVDNDGIKPTDEDVARSAAKARRYIATFPTHGAVTGIPIFVLVLGETAVGH